MANDNHAIEKMVLTALMTALVAVMTIVVAVPVPFTNGYVHFGDSMIFLSALVLGWKRAPVAAGLGSAIADVCLGYPYWAPWTLVIKAVMALVAGVIMAKCAVKKRNAVISCGAIMAAWLALGLAARWIVTFEATHNQAGLIEKMETGASAFGELLDAAQSQLMLFALVIPAALAVAAFVLGRRDGASVSLGALLGMTGGGLFMVFGYYVAGGLIYGNFAYAAFSMPANVVQFLAGFFIASLLAAALGKTPARGYFRRLR
jgi:uncharacterized membrane protein